MNTKKTVLFLLIFPILLSVAVFPASAVGAVNWYCPHVKGHVQPSLPTELSFIEECGGYFMDRRNVSADAEEKVIYLTFDAGYENGNVERILDILKREEVPAAFFILGNLIRRNTALVSRMAAEGHTVCNHTVRHKDLSGADETAFLSELHELEEIYREAVGGEMARYYRPPQGRFSRENLVCAEKNGYKTVFWSFAYPDWDNGKQMDAERAKRIILENLHNGEVMLLHPTSATNAQILGDVIREIKSLGYRFGTLDELTGGVE